ncbi:hypothetical protein FQN55_003152 [Onygenales sp. PD_40]|nr:hypothetical protein FQN55_003152 [Onygenales sp. PD_40]
MTAIDITNIQETPFLTEFLAAEVSSLALAIEALSLNDNIVHATEISGTEQSFLYRTTTVQSITMVDADHLYKVDTSQTVEMMEIDSPVLSSQPRQTQYKRRRASHQPQPQPQLYRPRQNGRPQPPVDNHHSHHRRNANYTPVQRPGQQPSAPQADRQRLPRGNRPHPHPPPPPHNHHQHQQGTKPCTTLPTPVVLALLALLSQCLLFIRKVLANKISGYQLPQTITATTTTTMRNRDNRRPQIEIGTGIETGDADSVNGGNNHQNTTTEFVEGGDERERI